MRLAALFLRSRRAGWALTVLVVVAVVCWGLTWFLISGTPYGPARGGLTLLLVFGALAGACVVGAGAASPFGHMERTVARPLGLFRFGHLGGLLLWSAVVLCCVLLFFDREGARPGQPFLVLVRNLAALTGISLLSAAFPGARVSWLIPFVAAIAYPTLLGPIQPGLHVPSGIVAAFLLAAGMLAVCPWGPREVAEHPP